MKLLQFFAHFSKTFLYIYKISEREFPHILRNNNVFRLNTIPELAEQVLHMLTLEIAIEHVLRMPGLFLHIPAPSFSAYLQQATYNSTR
jgi:hypothetical protein